MHLDQHRPFRSFSLVLPPCHMGGLVVHVKKGRDSGSRPNQLLTAIKSNNGCCRIDPEGEYSRTCMLLLHHRALVLRQFAPRSDVVIKQTDANRSLKVNARRSVLFSLKGPLISDYSVMLICRLLPPASRFAALCLVPAVRLVSSILYLIGN